MNEKFLIKNEENSEKYIEINGFPHNSILVSSSFYQAFIDNTIYNEIQTISRMKNQYFICFCLISFIQFCLLLYYILNIYQKYPCTILYSFLVLFILQFSLWFLSNIVISIVFYNKMLYFTEIKSLILIESLIILILLLIFIDFIFSILHSFSQEIDVFNLEKQRIYIILMVLLILLSLFLLFLKLTQKIRKKLEGFINKIN